MVPESRLLLVGSGPLEPELRERVRVLGLTGRVEIVTGVSDEELPQYYARADVFVLPACERSEAFGLVLVEALASGLPCVSTELGTGTSYVNLNGKTGLVVPPRDPVALADACNTLLSDSALRRTLGANGRDRATTHFDIRRVARQVATVYDEVLAVRQN
jgi:rhamnosyl/mannosyltransferase